MHKLFAIFAQLLGALRLASFSLLMLVMVILHGLDVRFGSRDPHKVTRYFYKLLAAVLGLEVRVHGSMSSTKPTLFVSNHSSYLDIIVLGGVLPAHFVSKAEVARWPIFGFVAKMQRTVFVERRASLARTQNNELLLRVAAGDSVILFPEGTSSDGSRVLPFKSSLFSVAEVALPDGKELVIQPLSLSCTAMDGMPLTRALRPFYSWYGDMTLPRHVWQLMRLGTLTVDLLFHEPVTLSAFGNRKKLADFCQQQVASGVEKLNSGRGITLPSSQKQLAADSRNLA